MNNTLNLTKENLIEKSIRFSFLCKENHFSKYYSDLYKEINDYWYSMNISNSVKFSEKIYCWSTGINPLCKRNNKRSFISLSKGYNHGACYKQCPCSIEKHKETMQLLYNVDSPMQSPEIMKKRDDTFLEKYGTDKLSEINLKKKEQTNIDRYGHKTPLQSSEIRNKCKLSYKEKTGYNTPFENSQVQKNIQNHWEETTGKNTHIRTKEDGIKESEKYIKENFGEKGLVLLDKHDLEKVIEKLSPYMLSKQIGCSEGLIYKKN